MRRRMLTVVLFAAIAVGALLVGMRDTLAPHTQPAPAVTVRTMP